jgi:hypothetical protein
MESRRQCVGKTFKPTGADDSKTGRTEDKVENKQQALRVNSTAIQFFEPTIVFLCLNLPQRRYHPVEQVICIKFESCILQMIVSIEYKISLKSTLALLVVF